VSGADRGGATTDTGIVVRKRDRQIVGGDDSEPLEGSEGSGSHAGVC
jgi:hypothetical protein